MLLEITVDRVDLLNILIIMSY